MRRWRRPAVMAAGREAERSYEVLRSLYAGPFVVARDLDVFR